MMIQNKLPYTHLMYVRKYSSIADAFELYIVGVNTNDIFHTMGEYVFRSETFVKCIDYVECAQHRLDFWKEKGYEIYEFKDKYSIPKERK